MFRPSLILAALLLIAGTALAADKGAVTKALRPQLRAFDAARFDLVLLDWMLPKLDGLGVLHDVARVLRRTGRVHGCDHRADQRHGDRAGRVDRA